MKNSIAERIADFIIKYPPFCFLPFEDVLKIAQEIKVIYLEKNQTLFKINDTPHNFFYIVKDGAVGLLVTSDMDESLIDKCDEGDILGLRPFFAKNNYLMIAKAREESILYAIPI
jgi:CBS domain-containing protein